MTGSAPLSWLPAVPTTLARPRAVSFTTGVVAGTTDGRTYSQVITARQEHSSAPKGIPACQASIDRQRWRYSPTPSLDTAARFNTADTNVPFPSVYRSGLSE